MTALAPLIPTSLSAVVLSANTFGDTKIITVPINTPVRAAIVLTAHIESARILITARRFGISLSYDIVSRSWFETAEMRVSKVVLWSLHLEPRNLIYTRLLQAISPRV